MKPLRYHSLARREYLREILYYERKQSGLGLDFRKCIEDAEVRLRATPALYAKQGRTPVRECLVDRFPHGIFFIELTDHIFVIAVANLRRKPGYWIKRLKRP